MLKPDFIDPHFFGCPFHGLIQGGQITLSNGQIKTCPQPRAFEWSDAGKTLLQRMPWASVSRTEGQVIDDTTKGYEWRTDALLCGAAQQLHGQEAEGWAYAGPDGNPWLISAIPLQGAYGANFSNTLTAFLFGRVNGEIQQYSIATALADTGQGVPAISETVFGDVMDITPDGSKAIIMLYARTNRPAGVVTALDKMSAGFLLLELSGTPGIDFTTTMSVLRNREQTLGQSSDSGVPPAESVSYFTDLGESTDEVIVGGADCNGYREITVTPSAYPTTGSGAFFSISVRNGTHTTGVLNRIVAMWFDAAGVPTDVLLSISADFEASGPGLTQSVSGQDVNRQNHTGGSAGACTYGPDEVISYYTRTYSRTLIETVTVSATLTHGVYQTSETMSRATTSDYTYTRTSDTASTEDFLTSVQVTSAHGPQQNSSLSEWNWTAAPNAGQDRTSYTDDERLRLSIPFFLGIFVDGVFNNNRLGWLRESNNIIGLYLEHIEDSTSTWNMGRALSPGGVNTETLTSAVTIPRYSSYNPATGQISRHNLQPVCWT